MVNVYEQLDRNKRRSLVVVISFFIFIALVIYFVGRVLNYGPSFIGMALVISGVSSFFGYWYSDKIILGISGARPADKSKDFLFYTVVENISIGADLPMPKLYVIEDSAPNAFATGRDKEKSVVCATTGLLEKLNRTELEGVIGHEMSHIKNYDMLLMSVVAVLVGMVTLLGDFFLRSRIRKNQNQGGEIFVLIGILFLILSPVIAQLIQLSISRRREYLADAGSVMITRQPSGLISALKKLTSDTEPLEAANKATAHLYIVSPFKGKKGGAGRFSSLFNTHPPVEDRIKALEEMV